jgi:thiamine-phosphate pyrophosphorylase
MRIKHSGLKGLYGITDSNLMPGTRSLLESVETALAAGLGILQYREKYLSYPERLQQAQELRVLCHEHDALLIINDDVELAAEVNADGVHLGGQDGSIRHARERLRADSIIGSSCYNRLELALEAVGHGADYVAFGRFFPSNTKPGAIQADPELLRPARQSLAVPICAIGGITVANGKRLIQQGADMLAVIHDLFASRDIAARVRDYQNLW